MTGPRGTWVISPQGVHLGVIRTPEIAGNLNWGRVELSSILIEIIIDYLLFGRQPCGRVPHRATPHGSADTSFFDRRRVVQTRHGGADEHELTAACGYGSGCPRVRRNSLPSRPRPSPKWPREASSERSSMPAANSCPAPRSRSARSTGTRRQHSPPIRPASTPRRSWSLAPTRSRSNYRDSGRGFAARSCCR